MGTSPFKTAKRHACSRSRARPRRPLSLPRPAALLPALTFHSSQPAAYRGNDQGGSREPGGGEWGPAGVWDGSSGYNREAPPHPFSPSQ